MKHLKDFALDLAAITLIALFSGILYAVFALISR